MSVCAAGLVAARRRGEEVRFRQQTLQGKVVFEVCGFGDVGGVRGLGFAGGCGSWEGGWGFGGLGGGLVGR